MKALWSFTNFLIEKRDIYIWGSKSRSLGSPRERGAPVTSGTFLREIHQKGRRGSHLFLPRFSAETLGFVLFVKFLLREPGAAETMSTILILMPVEPDVQARRTPTCPRLLSTSKRNENVYCDEREISSSTRIRLFTFSKNLEILSY